MNLLLGDSGNWPSGVLPPDEVSEKINSPFGPGTNEEPSEEGGQDVDNKSAGCGSNAHEATPT